MCRSICLSSVMGHLLLKMWCLFSYPVRLYFNVSFGSLWGSQSFISGIQKHWCKMKKAKPCKQNVECLLLLAWKCSRKSVCFLPELPLFLPFIEFSGKILILSSNGSHLSELWISLEQKRFDLCGVYSRAYGTATCTDWNFLKESCKKCNHIVLLNG